ncbi:MAG: hypothetical protein U0T82_01710 [Bacteroidales bacterium]
MAHDEILRVTGRKRHHGEVEEFICNTCRLVKKTKRDWVIEGPRQITRQSVLSVNHYEKLKKGAVLSPVDKLIIDKSEE